MMFEVVSKGFGNVEYRGKTQVQKIVISPIKQEDDENIKRIREEWKKIKGENQ